MHEGCKKTGDIASLKNKKYNVYKIKNQLSIHKEKTEPSRTVRVVILSREIGESLEKFKEIIWSF